MNHKIPVRIYYEDTDAGGIVYHANHFKFAERARTELLRDIGYENKKLDNMRDIIFVVRHINADYFIRAELDDLLSLETCIKSMGRTSLVMDHKLYKQDSLLFQTDVTLVCISKTNGKPVRIPDDVKTAFGKYIIEHKD